MQPLWPLEHQRPLKGTSGVLKNKVSRGAGLPVCRYVNNVYELEHLGNMLPKHLILLLLIQL